MNRDTRGFLPGAVLTLGVLAVLVAALLVAFPDEKRIVIEPVVPAAAPSLAIKEAAPVRRMLETPAPPPVPVPPVQIEIWADKLAPEPAFDLNSSTAAEIKPLEKVWPPLQHVPELPPIATAAPEEPEIFVVVEEMPTLIGGAASILKSLQYPALAREVGLEGTVVVKVVVDEEGNPTRPTILRSVTSILDDAAVQAVMQQKFTPGRQRNRPVRVEYAIPVVFRLSR